MKSPIKCAIIGYGYMGEIRRKVLEQNNDVELVLICEPDREKLVGTQNFEVVTDPVHVIQSNAEAVFVCTPNQMIPELTIKCLERGKQVFCEKPPGKTLNDIIQIQASEEKNPGTKLMFSRSDRPGSKPG